MKVATEVLPVLVVRDTAPGSAAPSPQWPLPVSTKSKVAVEAESIIPFQRPAFLRRVMWVILAIVSGVAVAYLAVWLG